MIAVLRRTRRRPHAEPCDAVEWTPGTDDESLAARAKLPLVERVAAINPDTLPPLSDTQVAAFADAWLSR